MKIIGVKAIPVTGPRRSVYGKVYQSALGASSHSEHGLVLIDTDEGITGIGEISSVLKRRGRLLCREVDLILRARAGRGGPVPDLSSHLRMLLWT